MGRKGGEIGEARDGVGLDELDELEWKLAAGSHVTPRHLVTRYSRSGAWSTRLVSRRPSDGLLRDGVAAATHKDMAAKGISARLTATDGISTLPSGMLADITASFHTRPPPSRSTD